MRGPQRSPWLLGLAALAASPQYAAGFMPSAPWRLSKPLPPLSQSVSRVHVSSNSPGTSGMRNPQPLSQPWGGRAGPSSALRETSLRRLGTRRKLFTRLWNSASASAEGGEEKGQEEETEGGRVVFDENADWGTELPPYYNRPSWAPAWVPTWAVTLHPLAQTAVTLVLYFFHMLVLSKAVVPFPFQVVPNTNGLFQSIGLDSLAGVGFLVATGWFRRQQGKAIMPKVFNRRKLPFNPPPGLRQNPWRMAATLGLLLTAYIKSGRASLIVEELLQLSSTNVALGRAVQVLAGHLVWVFLGVSILHVMARPFFGKASRWMKASLNTYWVWWAIGGYYVSSLCFHVSDTLNQILLPPSAFNVNSVVTQMINPEGNDALAMFIGSLAPCVSAPWWEEVLYRGFLLPALYLYFPPKISTPFSAILFAAHHMSLSGMIPLATLGFLWAVLYLLSGNLWVPIVIHCLWNSRVFLGSYWGA